jgi:DNA-binding MarR family transcriptional regulator
MHLSNAWAAWTLTSFDALTARLPAGLGLRDVAALTLIATHDGCSVDWLRSRIGLTQSGTVRLVDRLEELQLVARTRAGRTARLTLRRKGRTALARWNAARDAAFEESVAGLSGEQRSALAALIAGALENAPRPRRAADSACRVCDWPACGDLCPVDHSVVDTS